MGFILGYSMTTQNHKTMTTYACIYIQNKASKVQYIDWRDSNSRASEALQKHVEWATNELSDDNHTMRCCFFGLKSMWCSWMLCACLIFMVGLYATKKHDTRWKYSTSLITWFDTDGNCSSWYMMNNLLAPENRLFSGAYAMSMINGIWQQYSSIAVHHVQNTTFSVFNSRYIVPSRHWGYQAKELSKKHLCLKPLIPHIWGLVSHLSCIHNWNSSNYNCHGIHQRKLARWLCHW